MLFGHYKIYLLKPTILSEKVFNEIELDLNTDYIFAFRCMKDNLMARMPYKDSGVKVGDVRVCSCNCVQVDDFFHYDEKIIYLNGSDNHGIFSGFIRVYRIKDVYGFIETLYKADNYVRIKHPAYEKELEDCPLSFVFLKEKIDAKGSLNKSFFYAGRGMTQRDVDKMVNEFFNEQFAIDIKNAKDLKKIKFFLE